jgi:hypothetical protein
MLIINNSIEKQQTIKDKNSTGHLKTLRTKILNF